MNGRVLWGFLNLEKITRLLFHSFYASHVTDIFHEPASVPVTEQDTAIAAACGSPLTAPGVQVYTGPTRTTPVFFLISVAFVQILW